MGVFTQTATVGQMDRTGVSWPEAHTDAAKMAALAYAMADMYGFGTVRVPFDITAEAERLGCGIDMGDRTNPPLITSRAVQVDVMGGEFPEWMPMSPSEFMAEGGRPALVCDAVSACAKRADDEVAVVGGQLGPMGLLGQLMSVEALSMASFMNPDWVCGMTAKLSKIVAEYGAAQRDAGADVLLIIESESSADIIDPTEFWHLSGAHIKGLLPSGDVKTVLHMCGDTEPIIGQVAETGPDALSPDPKVPAAVIVEGLKGKMRAAGSVDPVGTLYQGTPEQIVAEARMYADAGFDVVIPGCGVAPGTPDENMMALAHALDRCSAPPSWGPAGDATSRCTRPGAPAGSSWSTTGGSCTSTRAPGR